MWLPQTPKYEGPDQPGPCETQGDHFTRWILSLVTVLFPSTPHYDTTPRDPSSGGDVPTTPTQGGPVDPKQQALAHLLRAMFGASK